MRNHHLFNPAFFAKDPGGTGGTRRLDADWRGANGLRGLRYEARKREQRAVARDCSVLHVVAHLGGGR